MSRRTASEERYRRIPPDELLARAGAIRGVFDQRFDPETGKPLPPSQKQSFDLTEEDREFLYQLLEFLSREGKAAQARIASIQQSLERLDYVTEAHKELLKWCCEQWWIEVDKMERGRLMKMLHDGIKAPPPKDHPKPARSGAISVAGKTAERPGGLAEFEPS